MKGGKFSEKVRHRMAQLGIGPTELGRRFGATAQRVNGILDQGGARMPALLKVARALGVTVDYLVDDAIPVGAVPGLTADEVNILRLARVIGLDEAERRLLKAPGRDGGPITGEREVTVEDLRAEEERIRRRRG